MATIAYNGIIYGNNVVKLAQAEYNALPDSKYSDGILYAITDGEGSSSESGSAKPVELTQAQYDALGDSVLNDNILYAITDGDDLSAKNMAYDDFETGLGSNVQSAIDSLYSRSVNNNILINSNFANPVNQRGKDSLEIGEKDYFIDRWKKNDNIRASKGDGYIELTRESADSSIGFAQIIEESLLGKTVTFSAKLYDSDDIISLTWDVPTTHTSGLKVATEFINNMKLQLEQSAEYDGLLTAFIFVNTNSTIKIEWAKLELGDHATPYAPRLYQEEWLLCLRYYQKVYLREAALYSVATNEISFGKSFVTPLRVPPTLTLSSDAALAKSGTAQSGFTLTASTNAYTNFVIRATKSSHGLTYANILTLSGHAYADAEL